MNVDQSFLKRNQKLIVLVVGIIIALLLFILFQSRNVEKRSIAFDFTENTSFSFDNIKASAPVNLIEKENSFSAQISESTIEYSKSGESENNRIPLLDFDIEGKPSLAISLVGSQNLDSSFNNSYVDYLSESEKFEIKYSTFDKYIKEEIILFDESSPKEFSFELNSSADLTLTLNREGGINVSENGVSIYYIYPLIVKAKNNVPIDYVYELNEKVITLKPVDLAQFNNIEYPVVIDPTISWAYSSEVNYILSDPSKIEIVDGIVKLKDNGSGYPTDNPYVISNKPLIYDTLTGFSEELGGNNQGTVSYQISNSFKNWYDLNWNYRQQINLTGAGVEQTEYQVRVLLNTASLITAGKLQSGCQDIRIATESNQVLPYWIETGTNGCNTTATNIWVKVPVVPTITSQLYVYYGNSLASSLQDGASVFEFFEDFSSPTLNTSVWSVSAGAASSISNGELLIQTGSVYSTQPILPSNQNAMFEMRSKLAASQTTYAGIAISNTDSIAGNNANSNKLAMIETNATNISQMGFAATGNVASYDIVRNQLLFTPVANVYYTSGFSFDSVDVRFHNNRNTLNSYSTSVTFAPYLILGYFTGSTAAATNGTDQTIDYVLARKFTTVEPTAILASEESSSVDVWYWWNGANWVSTTGGYTESNTAAVVNTNISSFVTDVGIGEFKFRAFLNAIDSTKQVELDSVNVEFSSATAPNITSLSSTSGSSVGEVDVTITGSNFAQGLETKTYAFTGADQTYTVPAGVTSIRVKMWGGGGGGGHKGAWSFGYDGGGGGYTTADIAVTPGQVLTVMVGAGGNGGSSPSTTANYGGGGPNCGGSNCQYGGQGGGRSAIRISNEDILTAGGGGGGGSTNGTNLFEEGGGGGGLVGQDGTAQANQAMAGKGGTQGAGGAAGTGTNGGATAGTKYLGGRPNSPNSFGGSGGGGWYGGGGGAYTGSSMGGGGGGSSYIGGTGVSNASTLAASKRTQANVGDIDNGGAGFGGLPSTNGIAGKVVIDVLPRAVTFGGIQARNIRVIDSNTIIATIPTHLPGSVDVKVTNPDGQISTLVNGYTYLAPTVTSLSETSGSTNGGNDITITGTNFHNGVNSQIYSFTGADQTYTVPAGVTSIRVKMWGGGGGGGNKGGWLYGYQGGGGGYTTADIAVEPGQILTVMVGAGGNSGLVTNSNYNYGGGGASCGGTDCQYGGQGGGRSAIRLNSEDLVTAGGGGGGGTSNTNNADQQGGGGGGLVAQNGVSEFTPNQSGKGGTQSSGGAAGSGSHNSSAGLKYQGGRNGPTYSYGGSGGGGYWGGGAGGYVGTSMGGGGGGSSYADGIGVTNGILIGAKGRLPAKSIDIENGGAGLGGIPSTVGQPGRVIIDILPKAVTFGGVAATNIRYIDSSTIIATAPANVSGTVDIVVSNSDGQSDILENAYTYISQSINSITPNTGSSTGGTEVTISGEDFSKSVETTVFDFVNNNQTYVVPEGVTSISVKMWGGGGGGGSPGGWVIGYPGGAGGYTESEISVTPGQELTVMVGEGGTGGTSKKTYRAYGGGGLNCVPVTTSNNTNCIYGGQGGGRSAIRVGSEDILTAGGGGGGGSSRSIIQRQNGGAGGGLIGQKGLAEDFPTYGGGGGTQNSGGTVAGAGVAGAKYLGGSHSGPYTYGGAGGGGWYGGATGAYLEPNTMGGGGGGSSYIGDSNLINPRALQGNLNVQPKASDLDNGGKGAGGAANSAGQSGRVVISALPVKVFIGGVQATDVSYVDSTTITAKVPANAVGAADVVVVNPNQEIITLDDGFTYTGVTTSSVEPTTGSTLGGTELTITGNNFTEPQATIFDFTGTDQTYIVPEGVTSIKVKMWGAGGGGGNPGGWTFGHAGGGGGFTSADMAVTPGQELTLVVGKGGHGGNNAIGGIGYGGGGASCISTDCRYGGQGGGRSAIRIGGEDVITAGGGGGGGTTYQHTNSQNGGGGGGFVGEAGKSVTTITASGMGGGQNSGGSGGYGSGSSGGSGSKYIGGSTLANSYGGGGGGGWYGGGSGGHIGSFSMGGGGGGSSYIGGAGVLNGVTIPAIEAIQANSSDVYNDGAGRGGEASNGGRSGRIVIETSPIQVTVGGISAKNVKYLNSTTLTLTTPANTVGTKDVVITNSDGNTSTLENAFTYTGSGITSVAPDIGSANGGTEVTITGTDLISSLSTQTFEYTGKDQLYVVPEGVNTIKVKMWGGGGGASNINGTWNFAYPGGGGGYTESEIAVTPGQSFSVMVGAGGNRATVAATHNTYGGGGNHCNGNCQYGGQGGGRSAIRDNNEDILTAGGGGGGGVSRSSIFSQAGGAGGGLIGLDGLSEFVITAGGKGGTQSNGGLGGVTVAGTRGNGSAGSKYIGGNTFASYGGSGGGGWYGGGAGSYQETNTMGGGGGGSSYIGGVGLINPYTLSGNLNTQANNTDIDNGGAGAGGAGGATPVPGSTGKVIISSAPSRIAIGGVYLTNVRVVDTNTITGTTIPTTPGLKTVEITSPSGEVLSLADSFTVIAAPTINSVSPEKVSKNGGTTLTITGTNFYGTPNVKFSGVDASSITLIDSNTIQVNSPEMPVGPADLLVVNPDGQEVILTNAVLYSEPTPSISSLNPNSGPTNGGTEVTINGDNFAEKGASAVSSGLLAHWQFNEDSGQNIENEVEDGLVLLLGLDSNVDSTDPTRRSIGNCKYSKCLEFDGNDNVNIPSNFNRSGTLSYSLWFKTTEKGPIALLGQHNIPGNSAVPASYVPNLWIGNDGILNAEIYPLGITSSTNIVNDGQWHMATITSNNTTYSFYLDGVFVGSKNGTIAQTWWNHTSIGTAYFDIGRANNTFPAGWYPFKGLIDDVRIYNRPLTAEEVTTNFNYANNDRDTIVLFGSAPATNVIRVNSSTITATSPAGSGGLTNVTVVNPDDQEGTLEDGYRYFFDKFTIVSPPVTVRATEPATLVVQAQDINGNAIILDTDVTLDLSSTSVSGFFARDLNENESTRWDYNSIVIPAGNSSATFYYKDNQKGTPTVTAAPDSGESSLPASQVVTVKSKFMLLITGVTSPIKLGVPSSVTVISVDYLGNPQQDYQGTIGFSSDDPATILPANFTYELSMLGERTFVNGVTMVTQGEFCVTATDINDSDITGSQCNITVDPPDAGVIAKLKILNGNQTIPLDGSTTEITIQAQDTDGTGIPVPSVTPIYLYSDSVTGEFSTDGVNWFSSPLTTQISAYATSKNFFYRDTTLGAHQIIVRDDEAPNPDGTGTNVGWENDTTTITIAVGSAHKLALTGVPATLSAGVASNAISLSMQDIEGNNLTATQDRTVYLSSNPDTLLFSLDGVNNFVSNISTKILTGNLTTTIYVKSTTQGTSNIILSDASPADGENGLVDDSKSINIQAGSADKLVLLESPSEVIAGDVSGVFRVQLQDSYNNPYVAQSNFPIFLTTSNTDGIFSATAFGTAITSINIPSGSSSVDFYFKQNKYFETQTIYIADTVGGVGVSGLTDTQTTINITPGSITQLGITTASPLTTVAGVNAGPITAVTRNSFNVEVPTLSDLQLYLYTNSVATLKEFSILSSPWIPVTEYILEEGQSRFTFYYKDTRAATTVIKVSDDTSAAFEFGLTNALLTLNINPSTPNNLKFTTSSHSTIAGVSSALITATLYDEYNNVAKATSTRAVSLSTSSGTGRFDTNPAGAFNGSITSVNIATNQSNANFYYKDTVVGTPQLTVNSNGLTGASQNQTIITGEVTRFEVTTSSLNLVAGVVSQPITVRTFNVGNVNIPVPANFSVNLSTTHTTAGAFDISGGGNFDGIITSVIIPANDNSVTFYYRDTLVGTATVSVSKPTFTTVTRNFQIAAGAVSQIAFRDTTLTGLSIGEKSSGIYIQTHDQFGNRSNVSTNTEVYLHSSSADHKFYNASNDEVTSISIASGTSESQFMYRDYVTGTPTLTLTDFAYPDSPDQGLENDSKTISITNGAPAKFRLNSVDDNLEVGTPSLITLTVLNAYDQEVPATSDIVVDLQSTSNTGEFDIESNGGFNLTNVTVLNGQSQVTFYYRDSTVGSPTVSAIRSGFTAGILTYNLQASDVFSLAFSSMTQDVRAGESSALFRIQFRDQYGNYSIPTEALTINLLSEAITGTFAVTSNGPWDINSIDVSAGASDAIFYYKDTIAGTKLLTASSTDIVSATQNVNITANEPTYMQFEPNQGQTVAGQIASGAITVVLFDEYDNVANPSSTLTLNLSSDSSNYQFSTNSTPWVTVTSVDILPVATQAVFYYKDFIIGDPTITVSDNNNVLDDISLQFEITASSASKMLFETDPKSSIVNTPTSQITIFAADENNYETQFAGDTQILVTTSSNGGQFSADNGQTWSNQLTFEVGASTDTTRNFIYVDSIEGNPVITVSSAGLTSAEQTQTMLTGTINKIQISGDGTASAGTPVALTIQTLNNNDEPVSVQNDTVLTLESTSITGEFSLSDSNWVSITELTLNQWQNQKVVYYRDSVSGSATITIDEKVSQGWTAGTKVINTSSSAYFRLIYLVKPASVVANDVSTQFTVQTVDQYGNLVNDGLRTVYVHGPATGFFSLNGEDNFLETPLTLEIQDGLFGINFFYKDSLPGNKTITASDQQVLDNPDTLIINAEANVDVLGQSVEGVRITTTPYTQIFAGQYTGAITIEAYKEDDSPAIIGTPLEINLSTLPESSGQFKLSNSVGDVEVLSAIIPIGQSSVNVYFTSNIAGEYTMNFDSLNITGDTQQVVFIAAQPSKFTFSTAAQTVGAGLESSQFRVILEDEFGNAAVNSTDLTVQLSSSGNGKFSAQNGINWIDITQLTLTAGNSDVYFYYRDSIAATHQITVDESPSQGITAAVQDYIVTAGEAHQLNFLTAPNTLQVNQSSSVMTVSLYDIAGNSTTTNNNLIVYLNSTSNAGMFSSTSNFETTISSVEIVSGSSSVSFFYKDAESNTPTITVSDQTPLDNPDVGIINASQVQTINWGAVTELSFKNSDSSILSGDIKQLELRLLNSYDGVVETPEDITVYFSTTSSGLFSLGQTFNGGEDIDTYTILANQSGVDLYYKDTVAGSVTIVASDVSTPPEEPDSGILNATQTFTVQPANLQRLVFVTTAQNLIVGQTSNQMTVQARDIYGNITSVENTTPLYLYTTSPTGKFSLSTDFSEPSTIIQVALNPGASTVSFYYRDLTYFAPSSNPQIKVSNQFPNPGADDAIIDAVQMQTINAGNITKMNFTPSSDLGTVIAGTSGVPSTVIFQNIYDIEIPLTTNKLLYFFSSLGGAQFATWNGSSCGSFGITSTEILSTSSRFSFCYKSTLSGSSTITVSDTAVSTPDTAWTNATGTITVDPGVITQIAFFNSTTQNLVARHTSNELRIETRNVYGVPTAVSGNKTIFLRSSSSTGEFALTPGGTWGINFATIPNGQSSISVYYRDSTVTTSPLTITAADTLPLIPDTAWTNATINFNILQQELHNFLVTNISDPQVQGNSSSVVVVARDSENYIVDWYTGTISFSSSDANAILPLEYTFTTTDKGIRTFVNGIAFATTGEHYVRVTDTQGITGQQNNITVVANPAGPTTQVRFKDVSVPTNVQRDNASVPLTVQLRDSNGQGSNAGVGGFAIRVSSSSGTGEFASSPNGPWSSSGVFIVPQNFNAVNVYYKDSTAGNFTLTASDWISNNDDAGISNDTLAVVVNTLSILVSTNLEVNNNTHYYVASPIIFAKNDSGNYTARAGFQISTVDAIAGTPKQANLIINWKDPSGNIIQTANVSNTASHSFSIPEFYGNALTGNYTLEVIGESTDGSFTNTLNTYIPVSGWTIKVNYNPDNVNIGQPLAFTIQTRNDGVLADPENALINFKDNNGTDVPGGNHIRYLSDLTKTGTGEYSGTLQTGQLTTPDPYYIYARVYNNSNNTLAEDNNNDIFFENNPAVAPKNLTIEKVRTSTPPASETYDLEFNWDSSEYALEYNLYRSTDKTNALFQDTCSINDIKFGHRFGDLGATEPFCETTVEQNIDLDDATSWVKMSEVVSSNTSLVIPWSTTQSELTSDTYFYVLRAENVAGESAYSTMVFSSRQNYSFNNSLANTNWISMPYNSIYLTASDIVNDIEGGTGNGTNQKINTVTLWSASTQDVISYKYNSALAKWVGTDFDINPGDGISLILSGTTQSFEWTVVGSDVQAQKTFTLNTEGSNRNWLSIPYSSKFVNASDVINDIEGGVGNGTNQKINSISVWNPATQNVNSYFYDNNSSTWTGSDFVINPGDGILINLSGGSSSVVWTPFLVINPNE